MNRKLFPLLVAALLCVAAAGCWLSDARADPMRQLARMQPERSFAPRLSIPTDYHDCNPAPDSTAPVPREGCGERDKGSPNLYAAKQAGESVDPDSLQWSALVGLIWWDEEEASLDDAITRLEKALRLSTSRVPLLVDLSAAHLLRAERMQNSRDVLVALNYALEALAHEPGNLSAAFNAALALQTFGLDEQADRQWGAYLRMDSASPWAAEARERRKHLVTDTAEFPKPGPDASDAVIGSFVVQSPQQARVYGFERVLGGWGEAVEAGNGVAADSLLRLAERLGRALEERPGGDKSLGDAVRTIRAHPDALDRMALARAHRAYKEGRDSLMSGAPGPAMNSLRQVERTRPLSSALEQWTLFYVGALPFNEDREESKRRLRALLPQMDSVRYPAVAGHVHYQLGTIATRSENPGEGRAHFQAAARYLAAAGEAGSLARVLSDDAEAAYALGDTAGTYVSQHGAIQVLRRDRGSAALHSQLIGLGRIVALDEMPYAALAIYDEDVAVAGRTSAGIDLVQVHLARASALAMLGDSTGARRDLAFASARVDSLPNDTAQREWVQANIRLIRPDGVTAAQMDSAVEVLAQNVVWLAPALVRRADLRLAEGNAPAAIADLQWLTESVQQLTWQESNAVFRNAIIEQARSLFDRLVMLHARQGRPEEALRALERGRMSFAPRRQGGVRPGEGRMAAPPGHVAVEYALIGDTLLTWVVGDSIRLWERRVQRDTFLLAVEQAGAALESARGPVPRRQLRQLYDWLIRPIRGHLGTAGTPLVILADGEIARVPFAALMDGDRYLIEHYPLRFASTLEDAARPVPRGSGPPLLVANPKFARGEYPALDPLPGASAEADSLLRIYPNAMRLEDTAATRRAFVDAARRAGLIHYAGHAVFYDSRPERSYLLLAGSGGTERLTADSIRTMRLTGVRLVVLSACSTLRSRSGRSGGFAGFSGALLAAGAGGVVGSLWPVDDQLTQPLMQAFHAQYSRQPDPARTLRAAQLYMLRHEDRERSSPAAWAGFRYMGS
jgi:CHAT domain-containing protein